jgi:hypothetical protein
MKRLGPKLKMPKLKAPAVLVDVYWDLRDRRLLPLIALVVVAIAAVPFLLGSDSEEVISPLPRGAAGAQAIAVRSGGAARLTVVQAKPGLRDYRKRLSHRRPSDPFKQHYTTPTGSGQQATVESEGSTEGSSESTAETGGGEPESGSGGSSGGGGESHITLFAFAADIKIVRSGGAGSGSKKKETTIRHRVLPLTALPGDKAEVVTYMGVSKKGKPLFLVSAEVESVFGETHCVSGDEICQLIEAEPGFPVVFVYGANEVHYTINVLKVEPVPVASKDLSRK